MDLNINYEETISVGEQIATKGGELQTLLDNITKINEDLKSYWEGTDATKYTTTVSEQAVTMQKLVNTVNDIGSFLVKVGNAYQSAAENSTIQ